jgi:hypothetical protein
MDNGLWFRLFSVRKHTSKFCKAHGSFFGVPGWFAVWTYATRPAVQYRTPGKNSLGGPGDLQGRGAVWKGLVVVE